MYRTIHKALLSTITSSLHNVGDNVGDNVGNNKFMLDLSRILPTFKYSASKNANGINNYMYCSIYDEHKVVIPAPDKGPEYYIHTVDYGNVSTGSHTNFSMLILPFEEIELSLKDRNELTFFIETEYTLPVYDNGTLVVKSDD